MSHLQMRRLPVLLFGATLAVELVAVGLSLGLEPAFDTFGYFIYTVVLAATGALIAFREPANPIGWLFGATALVNAVVADAAQGWGLRAVANGWPGASIAEAIAAVNWIVGGPAIVLTFLLFPDGRLLRPAWQTVAWVNLAGVALLVPAWIVSPGTGRQFSDGRNPFAVDAFPAKAFISVGMVLYLGSVVASTVPLVLRLRRSAGIERQQLKWFVFAGVCAAVILPVGVGLWYVAPFVRPLVTVALVAMPIGACIGILRYRLYDIDIVISRTVLYAALTVVLGGAWAGVAFGIGAAVGGGSAWVAAGATLAVAVAFRPLRNRLQAVVDRRFNRARYEALQQVIGFLDDLRKGQASPEGIQDVLRRALGVEHLELRFRLFDRDDYVDIDGRSRPDDGEHWTQLAIVQDGILLGVVAYDGADERARNLLPRLVEAGRLAIEITRLRVELRQRLDEVYLSRARLVAVAEDERRRIERDLHDGAQQRFVSIGLTLRHAQHALGASAPGVSQALEGAVAEITVAIDELRELARGLRPAQLDAGLGSALRELASRAPLPVEVRTSGVRAAPDLEAAAYFTACEGLTNAVKHARATKVVVSAARQNGSLVISVVDDGIGGASAQAGSGLTGLVDRVAAQGGTLRIESDAGSGTTLTAEFPCAS